MTQLKKIAASILHGTDNAPQTSAQVWGIDLKGNLTSRVYLNNQGKSFWTPWMDGWNNAPSNLIDITAAQQGEASGLAQVWALDEDGVLHSCSQTGVGGLGKWTAWESNWQNAPKFSTICAASQVGTDSAGLNRGAQFLGVDTNGTLYSTYQIPNAGSWQAWASKWGNAPQNIKALTACKQNNDKLVIWALGKDNVLNVRAQTEVGGSWNDWDADWRNPPFAFSAIGAVQQGGDRGAQFWGIHGDGILTSIFEQSPGTNWTEWTQGNWHPSDPPNLKQIAGCQIWSHDSVFLWALNENGNIFFNHQLSAGGNWAKWEAWE